MSLHDIFSIKFFEAFLTLHLIISVNSFHVSFKVIRSREGLATFRALHLTISVNSLDVSFKVIRSREGLAANLANFLHY